MDNADETPIDPEAIAPLDPTVWPKIPQILVDSKNGSKKLRPARPATPEELQIATSLLKPHQCAYPDGSQLSRQTGLPCRYGKERGRTRCRLHGGRTPVGARHPSFRDGARSKHLPKGLGQAFREALADEDYLDAREDIGLMTARIDQLLDRLTDCGSSEAWSELRKQYDLAMAAQQAQDYDGMAAALARIGEIAHNSAEAEAVWHDIYEAQELKAKLRKDDVKRLISMKKVMTMQQAIEFASVVVHSVQSRVTNREEVALVIGDLNRLLSSQGGVIQPADISVPRLKGG